MLGALLLVHLQSSTESPRATRGHLRCEGTCLGLSLTDRISDFEKKCSLIPTFLGQHRAVMTQPGKGVDDGIEGTVYVCVCTLVCACVRVYTCTHAGKHTLRLNADAARQSSRGLSILSSYNNIFFPETISS